MADAILVAVEQGEGKLNRASRETLVAGQQLAATTGWTLEAAVAGTQVSSIAAEIAAKKLSKVYDIESHALASYTPDAYAATWKQSRTSAQPRLVLMPPTYQVRDFVPKLATSMERSVISDCIGFRKHGEKL